ncbi:hypothetical protein JCM21714_1705 [Gracilibacillus boraciitolerans JCM 21714]|uniref:JAB domain-containing protein n=1 Tax=Gracilibacillus boraciitolerans JCM 21714 TaxID=1298598 RepID=W4VIW0_9BACI|nr:M67 family metallopeptidase [Gracilibacillus boraciitolerans]GAE92694.1 hypothetical protein JCM21714_1705 [Gracilibacillus boraciitolerans JCM 21714]
MEKIIEVPFVIYQEIVKEGQNKLPNEACGLITGKSKKVLTFWPLVNEAHSSHRYYVSKEIVQQNLQKMYKKEEQLLAIFHTHPTTAPVPSPYDIKNHPDDSVDMVIVSYKFDQPKLKWYTKVSSQFKNISWSLVK